MEDSDNDAIVDDGEHEAEEDDDIGVPLVVVDSLTSTAPSTVVANRSEQRKLQNSKRGYVETAILDCFELAVRTHDYDASENGAKGDDDDNTAEMDWMPPSSFEETSGAICDSNGNDLSFLKTWSPKPLTLPIWAVDPIIAEQDKPSLGN